MRGTAQASKAKRGAAARPLPLPCSPRIALVLGHATATVQQAAVAVHHLVQAGSRKLPPKGRQRPHGTQATLGARRVGGGHGHKGLVASAKEGRGGGIGTVAHQGAASARLAPLHAQGIRVDATSRGEGPNGCWPH